MSKEVSEGRLMGKREGYRTHCRDETLTERRWRKREEELRWGEEDRKLIRDGAHLDSIQY